MAEEERALPPPANPPPAEAGAPSIVAPTAPRTDAVSHLRYLVLSMRPRQWTKNLIVFLALIFSANQAWHLDEVDSWAPLLGRSALAFVIFCLVSGADYLINDVRDRESDLLHPTKRRRPIAAGLLSPTNAIAWAVLFSLIGLGGAFALDLWAGGVVAGYLTLMLAYSFQLKHVVLLDIMTIAAGFVLRAMAGALVIDVPISPWLYVVTALGALFLAIHKRRAELILLEDGANQHRPTLDEYTPELLDQMGSLVTASTLVAYGLYTFTAENLPENHSIMLTIPFVLYGLFRYLFLVHRHGMGGSPEEVLLRDRPLMIDVILWVVASITLLLVFRD